jgi:hypothetical protein
MVGANNAPATATQHDGVRHVSGLLLVGVGGYTLVCVTPLYGAGARDRDFGNLRNNIRGG